MAILLHYTWSITFHKQVRDPKTATQEAAINLITSDKIEKKDTVKEISIPA